MCGVFREGDRRSGGVGPGAVAMDATRAWRAMPYQVPHCTSQQTYGRDLEIVTGKLGTRSVQLRPVSRTGISPAPVSTHQPVRSDQTIWRLASRIVTVRLVDRGQSTWLSVRVGAQISLTTPGGLGADARATDGPKVAQEVPKLHRTHAGGPRRVRSVVVCFAKRVTTWTRDELGNPRAGRSDLIEFDFTTSKTTITFMHASDRSVPL